MRGSEESMAPSLEQFTNFWWGELCKKVDKAIVFLDDTSSECLHWNCGGAEALFKAGALGVRELSSFESGGKQHRKSIFVTSKAVTGATEMAIRDIVLGSKFEHCIVITAAPATVHIPAARVGTDHHDDDPNNLRAFTDLENRLLRWMGNSNYTAEVLYCPLFAAQVLEDVFVIPSFADLTTPLVAEKTNLETHEKVRRHSGTPQGPAHHLAACLHSLLAFLGAKEEIFSMGVLSMALALELENLTAAKARRKTAHRRVALIVCDRSLDLASASNLDSSTCLLDRILSVLPSFPGHSVEKSVDMSQLCQALPAKTQDLPLALALGCALQPAGILPLIEARSIKEGLMALQRRHLEVNPGSSTLRVTPDSLMKRARTLTAEQGITKHAALLQQTLGVLQSLAGSNSTRVELLAGLQKVLLQNLAIGGVDRGLADVLSQVTALLKTRKERNLDVDSILLLLIQAFSLAGPDQADQPAAQEEAINLQAVLSQAFIEDGTIKDPNLPGLIPDETYALRVAADIIQNLFDIARARKNLIRYREMLHRPSAQQAAEILPLLPRLLADCLDPMRPELTPDVCNSASSSLRNTLGMFLSSAKSHPVDFPVQILLILGGVTGAEIRSLRSEASQQGRHVIIGTTRLIGPNDTLAYLKHK